MSIASVMPSSHLSLWCPLLLLPSIFPRIGTFPMSWLFASVDQNPRASASASGFPMNIQGWFPLRLTGLISSDGQKIDTFDLWCWRRLLKVSWTARRSNQSILREMNPEYPLEGLKLKLQYSGHLLWTASWPTGNVPGAGKHWGQKEKRASEDEMAGWHHWGNWHELGQTSGDG